MNRRKLAILSGIAVVVLLVIGGVLWQRRQGGPAAHAGAEAKQSAPYYCPMHTSITSHKPGNCPICGMKLVKRTGSQQADVASQVAGAAKMEPGVAAVSLSSTQQVMANVRTVVVGASASATEIVTTGRVTFDERRVAQVTSYTAGRIEQLFVNFTGDTVSRGETVASIYSPELYATQQEYLLALANRQRMRSAGFEQARTASADLVESTRRRLQLFGVTSAQIDRLASGGRPFYTTSITSPVSGIVTQKLVVPQQYVTPGQPLFQVVDLSTVWVEADVYEQDLGRVAVGQRIAVISPSQPGVTLPGTVAFIQPTVASESRATRVRIELPNSGLKLKPDMFVNVRLFGGSTQSVITVPATALVDRGQQQFVWLELSPGKFVPRAVTVGGRSADRVEILSGLIGGEKVVVEGGFLLDSEAQLRSATQG